MPEHELIPPAEGYTQSSFDFLTLHDRRAMELDEEPNQLNNEQDDVPFEQCFAEFDNDVGYKCSCCGYNLAEAVGEAYCSNCNRSLSWDAEDWEAGYPWNPGELLGEKWPDENDHLPT